MALAESALGTFDAFARAVLRRRPADARVLVCSDHGNVEDLRIRNHTRAPGVLLSFPPPGGGGPARLAGAGGTIRLEFDTWNEETSDLLKEAVPEAAKALERWGGLT